MDTQQLLKQASASHVQGDLAAAEAGYDRVLEAEPNNSDALFLSGTLYAQQARWPQAADALRRLVAAHPSHLDGWLHLAHVMDQLGQAAEAARCYETVVSRRPGDAQSWFHLGLANFQCKQFEAAERAYRRYVELVPDSVEGHFNLAATLQDLGRLDDAQRQYRRVLALAPGQVEAHRSLGNIAWLERRYLDAAEQFRAGLAGAPTDVELLSNLGVMLQKLNRMEEAEAAFRQALALDPRHVNAHFNLGLILLLRGEFRAGWKEYEWRLRIKDRLPTPFRQPEWDGTPLHGKTILLRAEQGFGDTFQFVRYASLVKAAGGRVVLECQPGLKRVLLRTPGIDMIAERPAAGPPLVEFDTHLPLLSLPRVFATEAATIPAEVPYIRPEPWLIERWAKRLAHDRGVRVGIVWAGRPTHEDDRNRSCSLTHFLGLAAVPGVTLYSLQKGGAVADLQRSGTEASRVVDLDPEIDDFADTAAAIANLDLVICVDTSVAHLAGAMNAPVWLVLPFAPDFRWLAQGETSAWYPSMRLFRQPAGGEWDAVFARLRASLLDLCGRATPKAEANDAYDVASIELLRQSRRAGRDGQWGGAADAAARVAAARPDLPEAHWLLGAAELKQGRPVEALAHLVVAYEACPQNPEVLRHLGIALHSVGEMEQAAQCYLGALQFGNDDPEVLYNLGVLHHTAGETEQASGFYQAALSLKPDSPECRNNFGLVLLALGRREAALAQFNEAVRLAPNFADAWVNLGNALYREGKAEDAAACLRRALSVQPNHAGAHNALGVVLKAQGDSGGAVGEFAQALAAAPHMLEARNNLGNALRSLGRLDEAIRQYRLALEQNPENAGTWSNLGSALQQQGDLEPALAAFDRALAIAPDFPEAHWNRALAFLLKGDYARGWPEYEWGIPAGARPLTARDLPEWRGEPIPGKSLLVSAEQGFGDTIQFARFLERARQRVGGLVLECQPELLPLLSGCPGVDQVIPAGRSDADLLPVHARVPLMSLAGLFGVTLADLPGRYPYLWPAPEREARFQPLLGAAGFKVGLAWAGSTAHQDDRNRSLDALLLAPLLEIPEIGFFSLQFGGDARAGVSGLTEVTPLVRDFADTAGAIAQLDLVICVDTAVAHLAGAMGKPVWILLPHAPDWRWGREGAGTPWYPSARLFRQAAPGQWAPVIRQVAAALRDSARA